MKKLIEKRENSILNTSPLSNQFLNLKLGLMPNINSGIKKINKPILRKRFKSPDITKILDIRSKMLSQNEKIHSNPIKQMRSRCNSPSITFNL